MSQRNERILREEKVKGSSCSLSHVYVIIRSFADTFKITILLLRPFLPPMLGGTAWWHFNVKDFVTLTNKSGYVNYFPQEQEEQQQPARGCDTQNPRYCHRALSSASIARPKTTAIEGFVTSTSEGGRRRRQSKYKEEVDEKRLKTSISWLSLTQFYSH